MVVVVPIASNEIEPAMVLIEIECVLGICSQMPCLCFRFYLSLHTEVGVHIEEAQNAVGRGERVGVLTVVVFG